MEDLLARILGLDLEPVDPAPAAGQPTAATHSNSSGKIVPIPDNTPASGPPPPSERELMTRLRHMLEGRCDVILRTASPETRQSDAPMVLDRLCAPEDSLVRQPPIAAQRALA